ncbi:MAG: acyl-CoA dehydrogenase family protein [Burkholderiaceae bacterium]
MIRDPARLDALLAEVRAFVRDECIPMEARIDREDVVPDALVARMRALGLFGHSIPEAYGGAGLTTEELARVNIEVSQAAPVIRARFGGNTGIGSEALISDGTPAQRSAWLPRLASGELTGCFALTEPEAGSDATAMRTRAVAARGPDGRAGYTLDGLKCYITNAPIADLFTVFARTDEAARGAAGITAFLIPRGTPGLSTGPAYRKLGQHGSPVGEVHLDACWVPEDAILGGLPGEGFRSAMRALNKQRINLAGLCVGPAIRLLDEALAHARTRRQFGQPIGEFQLVQAMLADSATEIAAARALVLETARKRDAGEDVTMDVSMCKLYASETCGRVADRAVQILGGAGYIEDHPIVRLYRDVRLFRLYEGTSQIHQINIAKHLLKGGA